MSQGRLAAADTLRDQIQAAADAHELGAKILFVGLQDIHPPVKVAGDYEKVVGAEQTKLSKILDAAGRCHPHQRAGRGAGVHHHQCRRSRPASSSKSRPWPARPCSRTRFRRLRPRRRFTGSAPIFKTFANATANARKYILLVTNTDDVVIFNLEDSIREDLLNLNVNQKP